MMETTRFGEVSSVEEPTAMATHARQQTVAMDLMPAKMA
jgi:hypothetical protein